MAKGYTKKMEAELIAEMQLRKLKRETEIARKEAIRACQDFPLLSTSEIDALPNLPEEAGDGLTPGQRLAVAAIVAGQTFINAAKAAGVSRQTVHAWRQQPAFDRAVDRLSRDALEATAIRVRNLMLRSTRVLAESMLGPDAFNGAIRVANSGRLWAALNAGAAKLEEKLADDVVVTSKGERSTEGSSTLNL